MFFQTILLLGIMLTLLTIISTLGGSINVKEHFDEENAADKHDIARNIGGEIIRAGDYGAVSNDEDDDDEAGENHMASQESQESGADDYGGGSGDGDGSEERSDGAIESYANDEGMIERRKETPPDVSAVIEPFDGDMYAAYGR
jgi:hypothetical protein